MTIYFAAPQKYELCALLKYLIQCSVAVWQCGSVVRTQVLGFPALPNGQPHLRAIGRLMQEVVLIKHCL